MGLNFNLIAQNSISPLCEGPNSLLALIDRPTFAFSACVVPKENVLIESGSQYIQLQQEGTQFNLPETELRVGLFNQLEVDLFVPNYIHQSVDPKIGFTAMGVGMKHVLLSNEKSVLSVLGVVVPPSGSASFGSRGVSGFISSILTFNMSPEIGVTAMLQASSQTLPINFGGQRFTAIDPFLVLSWNKEKLSLYGEIYGQNKTGPKYGGGTNMDVGIIYLIKRNIALDVEIGKSLKGILGNFNQYVGTGISVRFE